VSDEPLAGVTFVDHTADVGMDLVAGELEELFHLAALGMLALLRGHDDEDGPRTADPATGPHRAAGAGGAVDPGPADALLELEAPGPARLLAAWLRELLFLHETAGRDYAGAAFERLGTTGLRARVALESARPAIREIKGVTYHELGVERTDHGWKGRVIFDV
jgi:SHS2 domain-containing protein